MNNNSILKSDISKLSNCISSNINIINKKYCIRCRNLYFKDIFYFSSLYNINSKATYDTVYSKIILNNDYTDITKNAFIKRRSIINSNDYLFIVDKLVEFIYKNNNFTYYKSIKRIVAVDGSQINCLSSLNTDLNNSKHENYTTGLLSCLYDVNLEIPINYSISNDTSEINSLVNQLKYLSKGDLLIADRGYYSESIIFYLNEKNINFLFRIRSNFYMCTQLENSKQNNIFFNITHNNKIINVQLIKYKTFKSDITYEKYSNYLTIVNTNKQLILKYKNNIKMLNEEHILLTKISKNIKYLTKNNTIKKININYKNKINLKKECKSFICIYNTMIDDLYKMNEFYNKDIKEYERAYDSIYYIITDLVFLKTDDIMNIYKLRWGVETSFRYGKSELKLREYESKNYNILTQNIYQTQFILVLEGYIQYLLKNFKNADKKFNKTTSFGIMESHILKIFLYDKKINKKTMKKLIDIFLFYIKYLLLNKQDTATIYKPRCKKRPSLNWSFMVI